MAIRACVFDAYGTVFDFASAARSCPGLSDAEMGALTGLWRDKQLQYTWLRSLEQLHADFWQITGDALDFALEALGIARPGLRERLLELYQTLPVFPEVPATLAKLRAAGMKTAILSNGTPEMLAAAVLGNHLGGLFDAVISVEEVGVFKPDPRVYRRVLERFSITAAEVSFQSSNAWDAYAARAFGMQAIWCNRTGQPPERLPGKPDHVVPTLALLPSVVGC